MLWILPLLSLCALTGYWAWNARLRRDCDAKLAEGAALLETAKYRQAVAAFDTAFALASRITMGQGDRPIYCALHSAEALSQAGQKAPAYQAAMAAYMMADRQNECEYTLRLYRLMADLSEDNSFLYRALGMRQVVVAMLKQDVLRKTASATSLPLAVELGKLGTALAAAGLPEHAVKALDDAAEILRQHPEEARSYSATLIQMGPLCSKLGQYDRAETALKAALTLEKEQGADSKGVEVLSELGSLYCAWGRYEEAFPHFEEAYRLQVRACGASDARVGLILSSYANCLRAAGRLQTAEETATRAVKVLEMNQHPGLANSLGTLGAVIAAEGDYTRAVAMFEKADEASTRTDSAATPLDAAERLENHANALEHLSRALEAEHLRSGAASIRSSLAAAPPAGDLFEADLEELLQTPEWPRRRK